MKRRDFSKGALTLGIGLMANPVRVAKASMRTSEKDFYLEPARKLPSRHFDVVIAGGGTAGVMAAIAAVMALSAAAIL